MNTRTQMETAILRGFSGKQTESTEIISATISTRSANAARRGGRILADTDPGARAVVLNWLLGDLSQLLDADETASAQPAVIAAYDFSSPL